MRTKLALHANLEDQDNDVEVVETNESEQTVMIMLPVTADSTSPILDVLLQTAKNYPTSMTLKLVVDNLRFDLESAKRGALPPTPCWH